MTRNHMHTKLEPLATRIQPAQRGSRLAVLLAISFLIVRPATSFSQGTAFTYQGRLTDGPTPASGSYDFTFQIFNAATGGASQGALITTNALSLADGLFTVALDFGPGSFSSGAPRWLEI